MTLADAVHAARMGRCSSLRCPAHDDHSPSLSVSPGRNGAVLIKCHTGCPTESVLTSVGLKWADICAPNRTLQMQKSFTSTVRQVSQSWNDPERRRKRALWPTFESPTNRDLNQIAAVRGLGRGGLELAVARGLLRVLVNYRGHRCWVVTDASRMSAQARRLDGLPFQAFEGLRKALTLPGSIASWPIGMAALNDNHRSVLLTEGGPDFLAAHHFVDCEGRQNDAGAVGILGASCNIPTDVLTGFEGRWVRIAQHSDPAGKQAAIRWARQLQSHARRVDGINFTGLRQFNEQSVNDLNDLIHIHPDDFEHHRWAWRIVP